MPDLQDAVSGLRRDQALRRDARIIVEAALSGVRTVPSQNLHRIDFVVDGLSHRVDCIVDGLLQAIAERLAPVEGRR